MKTYIAWLNGTSVARGTEQEVRSKAIEIFNSYSWQQTVTERGKPTELRITKGARQSLVASEQLSLRYCSRKCGALAPAGRTVCDACLNNLTFNQSVKGDAR